MADLADQLWAQQQVIVQVLADLRADVKGLQADVTVQLGHGSRKMDDHEQRLREIEAALPDKLGDRLDALESAADQRRGRVSVLQLVLSLLLTLLGSSMAAAVATYLLTHHH